MNRRNFLKLNALSLASIGIAYANPMHHHGHDTHNNTDIDTSFIEFAPKNLKLLDPQAFPKNQILKPLPLLKNESNEKNIFRATLEIKESYIELIKGKKTKFYTYNGLIPGPKIEVFEGDKLEILVKNKLKEPTTIHWHGVLVPADQDGSPHDPILAGEEKTYRFKIPQNSAGTYWYHPHPHFITSKQVFMGLAGTFVIKAKEDALSHLKEKDLMISDLRLDQNAQIPNNTLNDWLNGREGEFVLINGQYQPQIELATNQRIRIYNATAARYLNLRIKGAQFILVGTDGGLIEKPIFKEEIFLNPASRVELLIHAPKGGKFKLQSTYYDRDKMLVKEDPNTLFLADINLKKEELKLPNKLRTFKPLEEPNDFKEIIMSEDHAQMHGIMNKNEKELKNALASMFLINGKTYDLQRIDLHSKVGVIEDWIVINKSHMDHPFHIHGTHFELISSKFKGEVKKAEFRALRDTINVRPNEELRLRMKQDFPGLRMYHCHILEHENLGMMGNLEVKE
ncbi:multicopper oxidase CueO [Campylobacter sp. VicNov18]|uniref:multicopper oxidase CueO n=1 Tax=Campylobacter bilis TaxID=2691918 RepID=UPI00130E2D27|nr:multicopper oxidase CueO [Campylobacter bilis]MPV63926.1 multicopper oxidase CueO [Campylobacter hepaticus]MBM0637427.1 multicopper oxidase CueO [Campylobacter bilis]MCC8278147.1 multicopper oxidase CueO [Campylobacter bilis]MCC8299651.1 multicopper oxidase CueO [Campylobacter bilis]MCC8301056.1 multicopper oxidase CueO [Campylobacter bilis]